MKAIGEDPAQDYIHRAITWLKGCQNPGGGWGESCASYDDVAWAGRGESTPSQTGWALLALIAAGEVHSDAAERGVSYLLSTQQPDGGWDEALFTGTGFPGSFYLRYYMYAQYFPLQALIRYRSLRPVPAAPTQAGLR